MRFLFVWYLGTTKALNPTTLLSRRLQFFYAVFRKEDSSSLIELLCFALAKRIYKQTPDDFTLKVFELNFILLLPVSFPANIFSTFNGNPQGISAKQSILQDQSHVLTLTF